MAGNRPMGLIRTIAEFAGPMALVATDVGKHQMWVAQAYPFNRPRQLLTSGGLGTMGFGLPASIGAALANPRQRVVCFSGDGSLQMNIQELATAVEADADLKIVLMDNRSLGLVRQQQRLFYNNRTFASSFEGSVILPPSRADSAWAPSAWMGRRSTGPINSDRYLPNLAPV